MKSTRRTFFGLFAAAPIAVKVAESIPAKAHQRCLVSISKTIPPTARAGSLMGTGDLVPGFFAVPQNPLDGSRGLIFRKPYPFPYSPIPSKPAA